MSKKLCHKYKVENDDVIFLSTIDILYKKNK